MTDNLYVGMPVVVGLSRQDSEHDDRGTIVDFDEEARLYKVEYLIPRRVTDAAGAPAVMSASWFTSSSLRPDTARMRDEKIRSLR